MADWNAPVPIARNRAVGGTQQARKQQDRTPDLFFVAEGRIGVLHGFIKKTQKTPPAEIALAQKRMKEMIK
jgi:phage-related protein